MHLQHEDIARVLFSEVQIRSRVQELGAQITARHHGQHLLVISVLRGAAIFMADLVRCIELPVEMDYMAVSSYGSGAKTSGVVQILKDTTSSVEGRHVIICEDILDSGLTLQYLISNLLSRNPASVEVAALLVKHAKREADVECDYVGFDCPDEFIVGYGLDYDQRYRNLPYIGVLKPEVYS